VRCEWLAAVRRAGGPVQIGSQVECSVAREKPVEQRPTLPERWTAELQVARTKAGLIRCGWFLVCH
jgi:hypothetical protein